MTDKRHNASEHVDRSEGDSGDGIDFTLRGLTPLPPSSPSVTHARPEDLEDGLLVCGVCRSRLVFPADCEEHARDRWYIELKCPDCGWHEWATFDIEMLDALDCELDRAEAEIEADLARLIRANMTDYVARFVSALDAGAIEPADFTA